MHWMSVMAEHISGGGSNPVASAIAAAHHHDAHYMWNGAEVIFNKIIFYSEFNLILVNFNNFSEYFLLNLIL